METLADAASTSSMAQDVHLLRLSCTANDRVRLEWIAHLMQMLMQSSYRDSDEAVFLTGHAMISCAEIGRKSLEARALTL